MTGITKRAPPISWRPSPAASLALAELMRRMGVKRNEVLNSVVIAAAGSSSEAVSLAGVTEKDIEKATAKFAAMPKPAAKSREPATKAIRTQQERMDDFYRANMAKGKK